MITIKEIEECLLDEDGSCRDINFENPTWEGAANLVRSFLQNYTVFSATTGEGKDIKVELADEQSFQLSTLLEGYIILSGQNSQALISGLQIFIGNPENGENGTPFVELTFFPSNLNETFSGIRFIHFVEEMKKWLQASWYYVRYENASWKFGSSGFGSRVIFQSSGVKDIA